MAENKALQLTPQKMAEIFRTILERAWSDPSFYSRLQSEPQAVLAELGWHLPPEQQMRFVMNTPKLENVVIPCPPRAWLGPVLRY